MNSLRDQIRSNAQRMLQFSKHSDDKERLLICKAFLKNSRETLIQHHHQGASGKEIAALHAFLMDTFIQSLYQYALQSYETEDQHWAYPLALIALGGYGRCELSPYSDIDIMFLYPHKINPNLIEGFLEHLSEKVLYPLWDLKIKVGHSTRTISDAINEANKDVRTKYSLIESRLICGSDKLFRVFQDKFNLIIQETNTESYIEDRLKDIHKRRSRYSHSPFLQEPNIKNGVGGLRDYQNILWLSRIKWNTHSLDALLEHCYLSKKEYDQLSSAYDFLLKVRNELHFMSERATEILNLEKQPHIAEKIGYQQDNQLSRVETFMKDYYKHTQNIYQIATFIENRIFHNSTPEKKPKFTFQNFFTRKKQEDHKIIDGFILKGDVFSPQNSSIFQENPVRLIRIYRYCQQYNASMDIELVRLIHTSHDLITEGFIHNEQANKCFRSILQTIGNVYKPLNEMHINGVLGRFMPEFGDLTFLVQHEYYHRYTADFHTLNTIKILDNVFNEKKQTSQNYIQALRKTTRPSLLYLILLLHDIGKAKGIKGHAETGTEIASPILDRLGINPKQKELILFVIKNHLEMVKCWQKYDVEEPETATQFSKFLQDPEHLHYLYVQTYCDAKGTSKTLWNDYKEALHTRLYQKTLEHFDSQEDYLKVRKERKLNIYKQLLKHTFPNYSEEQIQSHMAAFPERYFIICTPTEMELHIKMLAELYITKEQKLPIINWKEDLDQSLTIVNIVTHDHTGLFSQLAGAFSAAGLNILSTKAITRKDGITIDTFYVTKMKGNFLQNEKLRIRFRENLEDILLRQKDPLHAIQTQAKKVQRAFSKPTTPINLPDTYVNINHDTNTGKSIVEVHCPDSIGLLYRLTKAISTHNFNIIFARITTDQNIAIDTFHLENMSTETRSSDLIYLRESLNNIVSPKMPV